MSKPTILYVGNPITDAHAEWKAFEPKFNILTHSAMSPQEFMKALRPDGKYASIQGIVRPSNPAAEADVGPFTGELVDELPKSLRIISSVNHGYEKEDVGALGRRGVWYCNGAGAANDSTADIAVYLIIAAFRYTSFFERALRDLSDEGHYEDPKKAIAGSHNPFFLQSQEGSERSTIGREAFHAAQNPAGRVLGVVGLGEVGLASAKRAVALGMKIHYHSRKRKSAAVEELLGEGGATFHADVLEMLPLVDCVLVACPYGPGTHHIIGKEAFKVMKKGTRVVNVARGKCVDEEALVEALEEGTVAGVGLDVFHDEPKVHAKLRGSWRATLTPHIGGDSEDANKNFEIIALRNIEELFYGSGRPSTAVNNVESQKL